MARRVYLHIGTMKSGTTYLQEFCNLNRVKLHEAGLLWTVAVQNFRAVDELLGTWRERPGLDGAWGRLTHRIAEHDGDALVSNELLAPIVRPKIEMLVKALEPAEVHVIITARDLGKVIPSHWQEGARNRQTATWNDFLASVRGDDGADEELSENFWRKHGLAGIVDRWSKHVPLDRITLVTVPKRPGSPLELAERFMSVMGVELTDVEQPTYLHEKMGAASAELMRRVNERSEDFDWLHHQWGLKQSVARYVLPLRAEREPVIRLNHKQLKWAAQRAKFMTDAVAQTNVRVIGDLDDIIPDTEGPRTTADPARSTDAELLDAALDGIVGMAQILADLRIEYDAMVRDLEAGLPKVSAEERAQFDEEMDGLTDVSTALPRKGRLLRWKLRHLDVSDVQSSVTKPSTQTG